MTKEHTWRGRVDPPGRCQGCAVKELVSRQRVGALSQVDSLGGPQRQLAQINRVPCQDYPGLRVLLQSRLVLFPP